MNYFFGVMALSILTAISVNAQNQTVTQGSVHNYSVTDHSASGYSYGWSVTGPGNTAIPINTNATSITWSAVPGTYTISLTETNTAGSCATLNTFQVLVLGSPHLQFTSVSSANCANQAMDLPLTFSQAAVANYIPLVINYTVKGVARQATFVVSSRLVK